MRVPGRSLAPVLLVLALPLASAPALAQGEHHVEWATFDNKSSVAANDFRLRSKADGGGPAGIVAASIKRLNGTRAFPDTVPPPNTGVCHWPKDRLLGGDIPGAPADSQLTVAAEFASPIYHIDAGTCSFTRDDVDILTSRADTKIVRVDSPSGGSYALVNNEPSESVVLTNVEIRTNGDPASFKFAGGFIDTGVLVSTTSSVTLGPGASQTFLTTGAPANRSVSIRYDAALASSPGEKHLMRRADVVPAGLPAISGLRLVALAGLLMLGGAFYLSRGRVRRRT